MPKRGENIYKRKDGRWEGRYIEYYDLQNKAKYKSVYAHTYSEVKRKLIELTQTVRKNQTNASNDTFSHYANNWIEDIRSQIKHSTYVKYVNLLNNHINVILGNHKIQDITTDTIKKFADVKLKEGNLITHKGLSTKTVKDILSVIRLVFKYSEAIGIQTNCNFDLIKIRSSQTQRKQISSNAHITLTKYLLDDIDYTKFGVLLCLYTGMRIGEVCALRYNDISIAEKKIIVNKTMQRIQTLSENKGNKTEVTITSPKSETSTREIPIPDFILDLFKRLSYNKNEYILTGSVEHYIEPRTMENKFKKYLNECNLNGYTFHQLRHRFATHCIEIGFEVKSLSEILGHSNVNITLNRYVHSSYELKRINMDKLQISFAY